MLKAKNAKPNMLSTKISLCRVFIKPYDIIKEPEIIHDRHKKCAEIRRMDKISARGIDKSFNKPGEKSRTRQEVTA